MTQSAPALLRVDGVSRTFGQLKALDRVSFDVTAGSLTALIGPNGAGKTTMFNVVAGAVRPTGGRIELAGSDITGWPAHRVASAGVRRTFQNIRLFPDMSALENAVVGLHLVTRYGWLRSMVRTPFVRATETDLRRTAMEALDRVGMAATAHVAAGLLAQGQRRLVEIARAIVADPVLLMLDEPAAGLNEHETSELGRTLRVLNEAGTTILLVEHDMRLVMGIAQRVVVLSHGEKLAEGAPTEVQRDERVVEAYLGSRHRDGRTRRAGLRA